MNDIIGLRILAEEYKGHVAELLSRESHIAKRKKEALTNLINAYSKEAKEVNKQSRAEDNDDSLVKMKKELNQEVARLEKSLENVPENEGTGTAQVMVEILKNKIGIIEGLLDKMGFLPIVKKTGIKFLQKDNLQMILFIDFSEPPQKRNPPTPENKT